jgi:hypothetical protein
VVDPPEQLHLPIDAEDVADWMMFSESPVETALIICQRRAAEGRVAGIVLLLKGTDSGGSFVWSETDSLLLSLAVNVSDPWDLNRWVETILRPLEVRGLLMSSRSATTDG